MKGPEASSLFVKRNCLKFLISSQWKQLAPVIVDRPDNDRKIIWPNIFLCSWNITPQIAGDYCTINFLKTTKTIKLHSGIVARAHI